MTIQLPDDGFVVLSNITGSWWLYPVVVALAILIYLSFTEEEELYNPEPIYPNVNLIHVILGFLTWVGFDVLAFSWFHSFTEETFMFTRNLACIGIGFLIPIILDQRDINFPYLLAGRWRPLSKLFLFGITSFLSLGMIFWGFSSLRPFRVKLAAVQEINSNYLLTIILGVLLIPLTEEIIFRYLLYGFLRSRFGITPGIVVSSMLFASLHGLSVTSLAIGIGAVIMTLLVELTNSIIPPLVLHGGFNYLILCGGFWL